MCGCLRREEILSKIFGKQKWQRRCFFVIFGRNSGRVRAQKQQFCSSEERFDGREITHSQAVCCQTFADILPSRVASGAVAQLLTVEARRRAVLRHLPWDLA